VVGQLQPAFGGKGSVDSQRIYRFVGQRLEKDSGIWPRSLFFTTYGLLEDVRHSLYLSQGIAIFRVFGIQGLVSVDLSEHLQPSRSGGLFGPAFQPFPGRSQGAGFEEGIHRLR